MNIELREITGQNRQACLLLKVGPGQAQYIASNESSLREAAENPDVARPFALYAGDQMVGFAMIAWDENNEDPEDRYWLWRFMIDAAFQQKGYGCAALRELIRYFRAHGADIVTLSTKSSNRQALSLYHKLGFRENGAMNGEEIVLKLRL